MIYCLYRDGTCKFSHTVNNEPKQPQAWQEDIGTLGHGVLCCFSNSGSLFAFCTPQKELFIWQTSDWKLLNKRYRLIKLIINRWAWELVPYRLAGGLSNSGTAGRYPWQPCEQEPPLQAASNRHCHTERNSVENTYLTQYLPKLMNQEGGRDRSQNPQRFTVSNIQQ